jgi:hypothetical protein
MPLLVQPKALACSNACSAISAFYNGFPDLLGSSQQMIKSEHRKRRSAPAGIETLRGLRRGRPDE